MRKYYTRPCNFYYGNYARDQIKKKRALAIANNQNIAFDQIEIFERKKGKTKSTICSIKEIKNLESKKKIVIEDDIKKITSKRKSICGFKFNHPQIMGVFLK